MKLRLEKILLSGLLGITVIIGVGTWITLKTPDTPKYPLSTVLRVDDSTDTFHKSDSPCAIETLKAFAKSEIDVNKVKDKPFIPFNAGVDASSPATEVTPIIRWSPESVSTNTSTSSFYDNAPLSFRLTGGDQDGDKVTVSTEANRTVVDVRSRGGIGRMELSPTKGKWRSPLVIHLHLRGLESLSVNNGKFTVNTSALRQTSHGQLCELTEGRNNRTIKEESPFWISLQITNEKESGHPVSSSKERCFEVTIPDALLEENPETLFIQWIDFFRQ